MATLREQDIPTDTAFTEKASNEHLSDTHTSALAHARTAIDPEMRKRIVRKLDKRILPCLMFMYLANYVDRSNVAAARLKGLERDLKLTSLEYSNVISLFFVTYVAFQVPATFLVAYVKKPTYFICGCMAVWGLISLCAGFVHNYTGLLIIRLLLGLSECLFFPTALFTLSKFYTREEMGVRAAAYYGAALIAGAFGPLFAAGLIAGTDGHNGIAGWKYLFFIEGALTIAGAAVMVFILPNFPGSAPFLTEEERTWAVRRLVDDAGTVDEHDEAEEWYAAIFAAFREPVLYLLSLVIWTLTAGLSFNAYSPTLTKSLGFGPTESLLLTAPPFIYALFVSLLNGWHSDRSRERSLHIMLPLIPAIVGVIIPLATTKIAARYVGIFLMTGAYATYSVTLSWLPACFPGQPRRRAVAVAWLAAFSNTANIAGGYFFIGSKYGPTYRVSFAIVLAMFSACAVFTGITRLYLMRKNRQLDREAAMAQGGNHALLAKAAQAQGITVDEAAALKASFRFYL